VPTPLIFVTVGTDHHPFERAVRWADEWLARAGGDRARVLIQSGTSSRPRHASWTAYLPHDELERSLEEATVVVCHGGPGTIMDARAAGHVPVVLPRRSDLGEHVDDHQVRFCDRMAERGDIHLARTQAEFDALLERALAHRAEFRTDAASGQIGDAVGRFGELVGQLVSADHEVSVPPAERVRTLYVGGAGRSGSTLLDRVLGQVPGFHSAGELVHLWQRGLAENQLCGCGEPFRTCQFWRAVGERAFGGWDTLDAESILALKASVDRNRYIPRMLRPTGAYARDLRRYAATLSALYAGIRDVSGARVLIDSSKHASCAFLLRRVPGIDLRVVHLVRDARGVAFSWSKRVARPEVVGRTEYMPSPAAAKAAADWLAYNGMFEVLRATSTPSLLVRYEEFVQDPRTQVARVLELAGEPDAPLDFIGERSVELGPAHTVSGNPMRFRTGPMELRPDDEWRRGMDPVQRRVVSAIAFPLLARYGYPARVESEHAIGS
jgi:UDP-N-acetylglucosamine transferase subunit ALG13